MLQIANIPFIIYLLCAMHIVWLSMVGGWMIVHHRGQHDHSRLYIGAVFLFVALGCLQFIVTGMVRGDLNQFLNTLLEPYPSIIFFLPYLLLSLYVLDVMQSHWLTWKRFLVLISPWIVLVIVWLCFHGMHRWQYDAITHIGHVSEIMPNIHRTDVLLRVLLVAIYVPYPLMMAMVRYRWRICNVSYRHIVWLKLLVVLWGVCYILSLQLRIQEVFIFYFALLDGISIYIFALEKVYRIPVPPDENSVVSSMDPLSPPIDPLTPPIDPLAPPIDSCIPPIAPDISLGKSGNSPIDPLTPPIDSLTPPIAPKAPAVSPLAQRLQLQLAQGIWQNPDLCREDICRMLGTNYTYLASAIQELGFSGFHDMVNKHRTKYVHDELLQNPKMSISDVFYRAGYRNRTTAINSFKQAYHCTPSEFAKG